MTQSPPPLTQAITLRKKNTSLKEAFNNIDHYVNNTISQAENAQIAVIAVSKHLGPHSFHKTKSTPGKAAFLQLSNDINQHKTFAAWLQSHVTGFAVAELAEMQQSRKMTGKKRPKIMTRLSEFIGIQNQSIKKQWPWTKTTMQLGAIGYHLDFSAGSRIDPEWLKRPIRQLRQPEVNMIHLDLDDGLNNLIRSVTAPPKGSSQSKNHSTAEVDLGSNNTSSNESPTPEVDFANENTNL
ncbi:hypothetical protein VP01_1088g4 [Puccinia sorghi]|uniref:Uncharacterized protein n=1 Tax=Puccinia sorghi TaxID=27349 RepID=A0A0L6VTF7_9BASI|nr:hypothetical protein VP01_1088g4 [Puccinia sorghi]